MLLVSLRTQTATGEHAGPPQPETQDVTRLIFSLESLDILQIKIHFTANPSHYANISHDLHLAHCQNNIHCVKSENQKSPAPATQNVL